MALLSNSRMRQRPIRGPKGSSQGVCGMDGFYRKKGEALEATDKRQDSPHHPQDSFGVGGRKRPARVFIMQINSLQMEEMMAGPLPQMTSLV